ncbi:TKL family protein kinase [Tritrichomonas foetus]|uniref:TKL family protein kinase n=1 Tax=Tritrichomonas foetus TaxID=1144522 RepID=A0A1J4KMP9_9EUKA|nr:TKL family protein kinase [Tritrichomonas foetus]|eukprot:OHT11076.1 TKL family protein kinase [Tritrichomonas foetus]
MSTYDDPKAFFERLKVELARYLVSLDDFEMQKEIGIGGYGRVFLARQKSNGKQVAIKEWIIENLTGRKLLYFCREIEIFSKNDHPFLLPFIGFTATPPYSIITEYMQNGSLHSMISDKKQNTVFSPDQKNMIAIGIAGGMARLHEQNIIHRDLKSQNVLMDDNLLPKVCDFGVSRILEDYDNALITQKVGTPAWMAPEFFGQMEYTNKVDVYSYALILWELETGKAPFRGLRPPQIMEIVYNRHERPPMPPLASHSIKKLMQLCWSQKPSDRPSFATIYEWFATGKVSFRDASPDSVKRVVQAIDQWKSQQPAQFKSQNVANMNIPSLFMKNNTTQIIEYTNNLDKDSCMKFY